LNPAIYSAIFIFIMLYIIFSQQRKNILIARIISKKKRKENGINMKSVAQKLIGENCVVCLVGGNQYCGTIKEVTDGAMIIENNAKQEEIFNLDFVLYIRKYPKKEKKKDKKAVLD